MTDAIYIRLFCILLCLFFSLSDNYGQYVIIKRNNDTIQCESFMVMDEHVKLKIYNNDSVFNFVVNKDSIKEIIPNKKIRKVENSENKLKASAIDTSGIILVLHIDVGSTIELREKDFYNLFHFVPNEKFKSARYIQKLDSSIILEITYTNDDKRIFPYSYESYLKDQNQINEIYLRLPKDEHLISSNPNKYIYLAISKLKSGKSIKIKEGQRFYFKESLNNNLADEMNVYFDQGLIGATLVKVLDVEPPAIIVEVSGIKKEVLLSNIELIRKDIYSTTHDLKKDAQLLIKYKK